jgi:GTP 3',8-cyclase
MASVRKPRSVRSPALTDRFGRRHRSLRVSVTDRCNLRCRYCMPAEGMPWLRRDELATDEELIRLTGVLVGLGVSDIRITGGEPLVRAGITDILARLRALPGIAEISMTTNGVLLAEHIDALVEAGLDRLNVSVDSLDPGRFAQITRRNDLARVLEGLAACERHVGLRPIKVNAVVLRGLSEPDVLPLARLARDRPYVVRFIESMPIDAGRTWSSDQVIPGEELRRMIGASWPLREVPRTRPSAPGRRWRFADGRGELEFVSSVSEPFCASCDRLRLTADGRLRACLFATSETDLLTPLRAGATDAELAALIAETVAGKGAGHGIGTPGWSYDGRPMSMIGG